MGGITVQFFMEQHKNMSTPHSLKNFDPFDITDIENLAMENNIGNPKGINMSF